VVKIQVQDKDIRDITDTIIVKLYNLLTKYSNLYSIVILIKSLINYLMSCIVDEHKINIRYDLTEDVKCILIILDRVIDRDGNDIIPLRLYWLRKDDKLTFMVSQWVPADNEDIREDILYKRELEVS